MRNLFSILHRIGLPGAGKTTPAPNLLIALYLACPRKSPKVGRRRMLRALCSRLYEDGAGSVGRMCVEPHGKERCSILNDCMGRHPGRELVPFFCRGKRWLQERTSEELKGGGG